MIIEKAINQTKLLIILIFVSLGLFLISFIINLVLAVVVYNLKNQSTTVVLPMNYSNKYVFNNNNYDINYLRDMGISFIDLRLNNSPETVHKKHELLLSYVDPSCRPEISAVLSDEEKIIIEGDLSSAFYYEEISLYSESDIFEITGKIKTWSGNRFISEQKKTYRLKVNYRNGQFVILSFVEVNGN
ncbi:type IV conjugative transfer system protein TraE [Gilliamella sp. BG7]|uniref:type IV conjugative transfer system protein TraE n=1 Tax=unclassified Gilliamella TaxID=2685620 RepID=UPI003986EEC3